MRHIVLALALLAGCASGPAASKIQHSDFFKSHQAVDTLKAVLSACELKWQGSSSSSNLLDVRGEHHFSIRFDGDEEARSNVLRAYQLAVLLGLQAAGTEFRGRRTWPGLLEGFHYHYHHGALLGSIQVYSAVNEGRIEIRGVLEEHDEG